MWGIQGVDMYPVAGLGVTALIAKELWLVDEYWITGGCVIACFWGAWVMLRDAMDKNAQDDFAKNLAEARCCLDLLIDNVNRHMLLNEFDLSHPADLKNLYEEEARANALAAEYQSIKFRLDTRNVVEAKLSQLYSLEQGARQTAIASLLTSAHEYVVAQIAQAPADVQAQIVDSAIDRMSPLRVLSKVPAEVIEKRPAATPAQHKQLLTHSDPVTLLYKEFLTNRPQAAKDANVERFVAKDPVVSQYSRSPRAASAQPAQPKSSQPARPKSSRPPNKHRRGKSPSPSSSKA